MSDNGSRPGRTALCLCGGGITGAVYELGALLALDEFFDDGFDSSTFDIYVGTSAGALLASMMANGIGPRRVAKSIMTEGDPAASFMPLDRADVFRLDKKELLGVARDGMRILGTTLARFARRRTFSFGELFRDLEDALPSGLFSLRDYQKWLEGVFSSESLASTFSEITRELYITAYDLDSGLRAVFGAEPLKHVSVPVAICASSAIPVFFEPVRIDGRDYIDGATGKNAHIDIALERGADLVVVINPRVPIRHDLGTSELPSAILGATRIRDKGLLTISEQAQRLRVSEELHAAIERHRLNYPDVSILLIEPQADDPDMLLANPMNFAARRRLLRYGYDSAARQLLDRIDEFAAVCQRHRIRVNADNLHSRPWDLTG